MGTAVGTAVGIIIACVGIAFAVLLTVAPLLIWEHVRQINRKMDQVLAIAAKMQKPSVTRKKKAMPSNDTIPANFKG